MIANIINAVEAGKTVTLPKDSDGLRFVPTYVEDTARVFTQALEEEWRGVYNVAAPHVVTFRQLIDEIGRATGKMPLVECIDVSPPKPIIPNLEKISQLVDINSFIPLHKGLQNIITAQ